MIAEALAGLLGGGVVAIAERVRPRRRQVKPPEAICGCGHALAMHDPTTSSCHDTVQVPQYNSVGHLIGYAYPQCPCRQYVGPQPLSTIYAPEITP